MTAPAFPFFSKRPPVATPPAPAPVPPPVVAAPPPPAPVPTPSGGYEPRDQTFYLHARCLFSAALQPIGYAPADYEQANKTGDILARFMDSGELPKGIVLAARFIIRRKPDGKRFVGEGAPEAVPVLDLAEQRDALAKARSSKGHSWNMPGMTAAQMTEIDERLEAAGGPKAIPSRDDAEAAAAAAAQSLADVSEGIRYGALHMACLRICFRSDVSGARLQDAVDVVAHEIDRARTIAESCGQPLLALRSEDDANAQGSLAFPYPASASIDMMQLVFGAMPDISALADRVAALEKSGVAHSAPAAQSAE